MYNGYIPRLPLSEKYFCPYFILISLVDRDE